MVVGTLVGAGVVSFVGIRFAVWKFGRVRGIMKMVFETNNICIHGEEKDTYPKFKKVRRTNYGCDVELELPIGYSVEKFEKHVPVIEQALNGKIRFRHVFGRRVRLEVGRIPVFERMNYDDKEFKLKKSIGKNLGLPVYTHFGVRYIDFWDEATCHMLIGGATRMGKSVFLRLLFVHLMRVTNGNIEFVFINNKVEDYYPVSGTKQIPFPAETIEEANNVLNDVKEEVKRRKEVLRNARCINARELRKEHPEWAFPPLFVVVDEYGRFAEDKDEPLTKEIRKKVVELSETAGYLDVHLIIATQRPDVQTVLAPRIRQNLMTAIAFQTKDEANSKLIIGSEDAAHLGRVQGRAVLVDGMKEVVQVPFLSAPQAKRLLWKFREGVAEFESDETRPIDSEPVETLPSFVTTPVRETGLS